jgi:hypothetical protein
MDKEKFEFIKTNYILIIMRKGGDELVERKVVS